MQKKKYYTNIYIYFFSFLIQKCYEIFLLIIYIEYCNIKFSIAIEIETNNNDIARGHLV